MFMVLEKLAIDNKFINMVRPLFHNAKLAAMYFNGGITKLFKI